MLQRDLSIDVLRFIGISLIILAHISPPFVLTQFRCFDVPLMIFISGLTVSRKMFPSYPEFIVNRTKRLLVPVYIFISFYILTLLLVQTLGFIPKYVDFKKVVDSYLLLGGIGYVWIIRVFLLIMLVTPLLVDVEKRYKNNYIYCSICIIIILTNDFLLHLILGYIPQGIFKTFIHDYLLYLIGYTPIFMLGLRLRYASSKDENFYFFISILILLLGLVAYGLINGFPIMLSPEYKYPPQSFFLLYGAASCIMIWKFRNLLVLFFIKTKLKCVVNFIAQNTIWIYLWHIPFVLVANEFISNWILKYLLVYILALLCFRVQYNLVIRLDKKVLLKYFIG